MNKRTIQSGKAVSTPLNALSGGPAAATPHAVDIHRVTIAPGTKLPQSQGDIWPITWADDDAQYSAANDTQMPFVWQGQKYQGRNVMVVKIVGDPPNHSLVCLNPMEQFGKENEYDGHRGSWKTSGLLFLDKVLYLAAFHHQYSHITQKFPWWTANDACIIVSKDYGATWSRWNDATFFGKRFGSPSFIQFGRNGENATDQFVYAVSPAEERWTNNDTYLLGRVPRTDIADITKWTFFSGLDNSAPTWRTLDEAKPILELRRSLGCAPEVIYHPQLKSYLLATFCAPRLIETEELDQRKVIDSHGLTVTRLFRSVQPWGPWQMIYEGQGTGVVDYCPRIPCKWLGNDGRSGWIVAGGNPWGLSQGGDHYGFVTSRINWDIK